MCPCIFDSILSSKIYLLNPYDIRGDEKYNFKLLALILICWAVVRAQLRINELCYMLCQLGNG